MSIRDIHAYLATQQAMNGPKRPNSPNPNVRWGKRAALQFKANSSATGIFSATMTSSEMYKQNIPMAFGFRFGDPNNPDAPLRPFIQPNTFGDSGSSNIAGFRVTITRSIDAKTGPVTDTVELFESESMPVCELLARQITIAVTIIATDPSLDTKPWTIEVTTAPVDSISCDSLTEMSGWDNVAVPPQTFVDAQGQKGYVTLDSGLVDSAPIWVKLLNENPRRAQFSLLNAGPIPVAVGFGVPIDADTGFPAFPSWGLVATGSFPYATLILPGNTDFTKAFARYESVLGGFTGEVWGVAQPGQSPVKGIISVTEGINPVL